MSRRDQIRMTEDEIREFLAGPHTLQVATINPDGTPHLVAMWYAVIDGRVAFWTYAKSQKIRNLERDPRITVMVESGKKYEELKGVQIQGRGELARDRESVMSIGAALYPIYIGELDDTGRAGLEYTGAKRVGVFVEPESVVSWDHSKLGGTY